MKATRRPWKGGYIHRQKDGRDLFVIERMVGGRRFHVSTRAHSWTAAHKQLERFEADPLNYSPAGDAPAEPLHMTAELILGFYDWQIARGVTRHWARNCFRLLTQWCSSLGGVDLRRATLPEHIKPALVGKRCLRHRIEAIKAFYGWLRKERHLLTHQQDPTVDLPVPQAEPEKHRRRKAVEFERVKAAARHLAGPYRDVLAVMAATGWHVTELERFVREPESEIRYEKRGATIAALTVRHKSKDLVTTPITDRAALAAAERLRKSGTVPRRLNDALKAACRAAKVEPFTFGVMRHSVGSWAHQLGATRGQVKDLLRHKNESTTNRFYIDVDVPPAPVKLPGLGNLRVVRGGKR